MTTDLREDTLDEFRWDTIETTRDENGQIVERITTYDDGVILGQAFENGIVTSLIRFDSLDIKPWTFIGATFDENGTITEKGWTYDDGRRVILEYEEGVLLYKIELDGLSVEEGTRPWNIKGTVYDADGQVIEKATNFDDGTAVIKEFDNGIATRTTRIDDSFDGTVKPWEIIITLFDETGELESRVTEFDDGRVREVLFEDGVRSSSVLTDVDDVRNWDRIETIFDADGEIERQTKEYDNSDQFVFDYENGEVVREVEYDGNDSDPWLIEVRSFDQAGEEIDVVTYDTIADVPMEIADIFAL
jgi:antitoxin component YwqK of YwqJK toxin-antitoxin module